MSKEEKPLDTLYIPYMKGVSGKLNRYKISMVPLHHLRIEKVQFSIHCAFKYLEFRMMDKGQKCSISECMDYLKMCT
jgi:hypothetical protein